MKVAISIGRKSLQGFQQERAGNEDSPDPERTRPSEAEHKREAE
jgi:hypothetical protein